MPPHYMFRYLARRMLITGTIRLDHAGDKQKNRADLHLSDKLSPWDRADVSRIPDRPETGLSTRFLDIFFERVLSLSRDESRTLSCERFSTPGLSTLRSNYKIRA